MKRFVLICLFRFMQPTIQNAIKSWKSWKSIIWQNYQIRCSIFKRKLKVELPLNKFFKDSTINLKMAMNLQISKKITIQYSFIGPNFQQFLVGWALVYFAVCYRTNVEDLHCLPTLACNGLQLGVRFFSSKKLTLRCCYGLAYSFTILNVCFKLSPTLNK